MEDLTRQDLFRYLRSVQKAVSVRNAGVEPEKITEEEWAEFCMREGTGRLAAELIKRYGLDLPEN